MTPQQIGREIDIAAMRAMFQQQERERRLRARSIVLNTLKAGGCLLVGVFLGLLFFGGI